MFTPTPPRTDVNQHFRFHDLECFDEVTLLWNPFNRALGVYSLL